MIQLGGQLPLFLMLDQLSWNNITVFPYNTFNWIGLDGSEVLAHLAPADTYNAQCDLYVSPSTR